MRIGIDARMYGKEQTGIGRYIQHLTEELFRMDSENEYLMFLSSREFGNYKPPTPRVKKLKAQSPWYGIREQLLLPFEFLRARLDLLHVPHFNAPMWYPGRSAVTIHDVTQLHFPGPASFTRPLRRFAYRMVFRNAVHRASRVIAVSEYTKGEIIRHFGVPREKISVIYEGPPLLRISNLESRISNNGTKNILNSGFTIQDSPYILYVGVLRPHKNIMGLLEAFAMLKAHPDFRALHLLLVGREDPRYPETRGAIQKLRLEQDVAITGFLSDKELAACYQKASCVVIPAFAEGFGLVGLEALARGAPVAASCGGALPEVLGKAAVYFDPYDPAHIAHTIARLLCDASLRGELLSAAPKALARYSWRRAASETLRVYHEAARP